MRKVKILFIMLAMMICMTPVAVFAEDAVADTTGVTSESEFMEAVTNGEVTLGGHVDLYNETLIIENDTIINLNGNSLWIENPIQVRNGAVLTVNSGTPDSNLGDSSISAGDGKNIFNIKGNATLNLNEGRYNLITNDKDCRNRIINAEADDSGTPTVNIYGDTHINAQYWNQKTSETEYLYFYAGELNIVIKSCKSNSYIDKSWVSSGSTLLIEDYGEMKNYLVVDDSDKKSDAYINALNLQDGSMSINSVHPTEYDGPYWFYDVIDESAISSDAKEKGYQLKGVSGSFDADSDTIYIRLINDVDRTDECHKVKLIFKGDLPENAEIKAKLEKAASKIPLVKTYGVDEFNDSDLPKYNLSDMELFNLWIACEASDNDEEMGGPYRCPLFFSDEFKKAISYTNNANHAAIDRAGEAAQFRIWEKGEVNFNYDGITYVTRKYIASANHILYVAAGTKEEDLLKAGQDRLDAKFGKDKIKIEDAGTIFEARLEWYRSMRAQPEGLADELWQKDPEGFDYDKFNADWRAMSDDEWNAKCEDYYTDKIKKNWDEEFTFDFIGEETPKPTDTCYKATINGITHYFRIKAAKPGQELSDETLCKSIDTMSGVEVETDANIPLDTRVSVDELSSDNAEKQRIDTILKGKINGDGETYDIAMIAGDGTTVEKLEGKEKFKVSIPLSDELKDREKLTAYYVDNMGTLQDYEVTKEDGYAVFYTNHFSAYTLGEAKDADKSSEADNPGDTDVGGKTDGDNTGGSTGDKQGDDANTGAASGNNGADGATSNDKTASGTTSKTPSVKTGDDMSLTVWVLIAIVAIGLLCGVSIKKRN